MTPDAVRAVVGEVAELDDEAVGRGGGAEGPDVAMHVAQDSQGGAGGDAGVDGRIRVVWRRQVVGCGHAAASRTELRKASRARLRPAARSTMGFG